jgi:sigma-E factor negative regulatory protein RseB
MRTRVFGVLLLALPVVVLAADGDWQLFRRMTDAGRQQALSGTYLHQMNGVLETFHIVRANSAGKVIERRVALDGMPREIVRNGESLTCYAPDKKSLAAAKVSAMRLFPALMSDDIADISQSYTLRRLGSDRVARRDCTWLEARARDQQRYTERFCADQATALPLKMMTLTPHNEVIEQYTFTDVEIGAPRDKSQLRPRFRVSSQLRGPVQPPRIDSSAPRVDVSGLPSGFRLVRSIRRSLPVHGSSQPVRHMVFSDGMVMLSLFVEPIPAEMPSSLRRVQSMNLHGAINLATDSQGEQMLTLVGDMPESTLLSLVKSLRISPK